MVAADMLTDLNCTGSYVDSGADMPLVCTWETSAEEPILTKTRNTPSPKPPSQEKHAVLMIIPSPAQKLSNTGFFSWRPHLF